MPAERRVRGGKEPSGARPHGRTPHGRDGGGNASAATSGQAEGRRRGHGRISDMTLAEEGGRGGWQTRVAWPQPLAGLWALGGDRPPRGTAAPLQCGSPPQCQQC